MYCQECSVRLTEVCVAASSYYAALGRLNSSAGVRMRKQFTDAMRACQLCRDRCNRAKLEYRLHQVTHAA